MQHLMFYGAKPIIFELAKKLRNNPTKAEQELWRHLSKNQMGVKFRRQHPISNYIADFYCHKYKLVIELDGSYHEDIDQKAYDAFRTQDIEAFDIKVIRFSNNLIFNNINNVLDQIKKEITLRI